MATPRWRHPAADRMLAASWRGLNERSGPKMDAAESRAYYRAALRVVSVADGSAVIRPMGFTGSCHSLCDVHWSLPCCSGADSPHWRGCI